ncbi:hypothetical protein V6Z11_A06G047500 [Gossypium hirsutum]
MNRREIKVKQILKRNQGDFTVVLFSLFHFVLFLYHFFLFFLDFFYIYTKLKYLKEGVYLTFGGHVDMSLRSGPGGGWDRLCSPFGRAAYVADKGRDFEN